MSGQTLAGVDAEGPDSRHAWLRLWWRGLPSMITSSQTLSLTGIHVVGPKLFLAMA